VKFFNKSFGALSLLLFVFLAWGDGQNNQQENRSISADEVACRIEIEKTIEKAMALGDERGIALITSSANNFTNCLTPEDTSLGNLFHKTGVLLYMNNSYPEAIRWFKKALLIRENKSKDLVEPLLNTLNGLTQTHLQLFQYDSAEQLITRQLSLIQNETSIYKETKADLYLADAQLAFLIEDFSRCLEKLILASNLYESLNTLTFNHGLVLNMLGATSDLLNQPDKAIEYYQHAIKIFTFYEESHFVALSYHNMGMALAKLKKVDEATFYLNKSLNIHNRNNDSIEIARHFIEMAKIEEAHQHFSIAKQQALQSLKSRTILLPDWHVDVIESQVVLGSILMKEALQPNAQKKLLEDSAMHLFDQALLAALQSPRKERALEPLVNKAVLCASMGQQEIKKAKDAHALFQQADSIIQSSRLQYRHQESKIEFTRKIHSTYEYAIKNALHLHRNTHKTKYFEDALIFCERSKATAVRDKLHKQAVQAFAGLPDSLLRHERQLNLQLGAVTQTLLALTNKSDLTYYTALKSLEDVKHKMEEFDKKLEEEFPRYYQWLREPEQIVTLTDLQHALSPGSILLEYFIGDEQIYIFGVSTNDFQNWRYLNTDSNSNTIRTFIQTIESGVSLPTSFLSKSAYKTYQLLLEQPLNYFSKKSEINNLKIVPDGIIGKVPFDALMTAEYNNTEENAPYLINKFSHGFLYSNRLLLENNLKKQWFGNKTCAIFGIDYLSNKKYFGDSIYSSLPFIKEEVKSVKELNNGELFLNENATVTQLEKKLNDSEILHIAVHGSFNEDRPNSSGLIFSRQKDTDKQDNILSLAAIYGLHTQAQFIYLSSCFSGKGILSASEGIMSLSRAFTYAGAKSQVITFWEVSDRASALIAKNFYQYLKEGNTKDDALRLAKLQYIQESSTAIGQHPFYWAGSVVIGNTEPLYTKSSRKWLVSIGILIILLSTTYWRKSFF
jgi:CHAT domain-containing protein